METQPKKAEADDDNVKIQDLESSGEKKIEFTKTFTVEWVNPDDGKRHIGDFTVKRPTLGDIAQFAVLKARLAAGEAVHLVEYKVSWMNEMVAFCQVCLTDTPAWWDPLNMYDESVLVRVYNHVRQFQDSFRKRPVVERRSSVADGGSPPA